MRLFAFALLPILAACSSSADNQVDGGSVLDAGADGARTDAEVVDAGVDAGPIAPPYCATEHQETLAGGVMVTVCDVAFDSPPFVHLPVDTSAEGYDRPYGAFTHDAKSNALVFRTRTQDYEIDTTQAWVQAESMSDSLRYAYFIYVANAIGTTVNSVTPVVRIDDRVFQRMLAGRVYEGLASTRTDGDPPSFAFTGLDKPIRVRFEGAPEETSTDDSTGFPRYAIHAVIENATSPVTAGNGSCLPALSSFGESNPLADAAAPANDVRVLRHPNMHGAFDDVITWAWPVGTVPAGDNMGGGLYISPADLIVGAAPALNNASTSPQGNPASGPGAELFLVTAGGGESCTP
ncbi:MAG: hypothetical protein IPK60_04450 [Sandaracinaceae bacterium]|nr:hypothetical protein [Sandaracinaceae bacterium]